MSWERSAPTVNLALGPAPALTALVGAAYAVAIAAVVLSGLPLWLRVGAAVALAALGADWVTRTGLRLRARSLARIVLYPDDDCTLVERGGRTRSARLAAGSVVTARLAVLTVRIGRRRLAIPVSAGAAAAEAFRLLRVRLTVAPPTQPPPLARRAYAALARGLTALAGRGNRG